MKFNKLFKSLLLISFIIVILSKSKEELETDKKHKHSNQKSLRTESNNVSNDQKLESSKIIEKITNNMTNQLVNLGKEKPTAAKTGNRPSNGFVSNVDNATSQDAVAYNFSKEDDEAEEFKNLFVQGSKPKIVSKLTKDKFYDEPAEKISPVFENESSSSEVYYNGQETLKVRNRDCDKFNNDSRACLNQSHCGYCQDNGLCIAGSSGKPVVSCKNYKYFSDPNYN